MSPTLQGAIVGTMTAYENHASRLPQAQRDVLKLVAIIWNNWAFYIAERHVAFKMASQNDKERALSLVPYLRARGKDFPEIANDLADTVKSLEDGLALGE